MLKLALVSLISPFILLAQNECTKGIKEIHFSKANLKAYAHTYTSPDVIYLRKALNAYLDGVYTSGAGDVHEYAYFKSFDSSYYKSPFIVLSIGKDLTGYWIIDIIFQKKADKIFRAKVYNGFEIRGFDLLSDDACKLQKLKILYKTIINDKNYAL